MLTFIDPKVAELYTSEFSNDPVVHVPGGADEGWKGQLSTIPLWAAKKLIEQRSNLLVVKENYSMTDHVIDDD